MRKPSGIHKLNTNAAFVVVPDVVCDAVHWYPLLNITISFYIEVP